MPSFQEVLTAAGGAAVIIALFIGGAGFIFRQALATWLTRRLGRGLEQEAERYKHALARAMEKYKDELNRAQSVDRFRTEARKVVAERLLDRRLEALHEISRLLHGTPSWIMSAVCSPLAARAPVDEMLAKMRDLSGAFDKHSLYFDDQFGIAYRQFCVDLQRVSEHWMNEAVFEPDDPRFRQLMNQTARLNVVIDQMHKRLPDELANSIANERTQQNTPTGPAQDNRG